MKKCFFSIFLIFLGFLVFLVTTTAGLVTAVKLGGLFLPGKLSLKGISGRLMDAMIFQHVDYIYKKQRLSLNGIQINWQLDGFPHFKARLSFASLVFPLTDEKILKSKQGQIVVSGLLSKPQALKVRLVSGPNNVLDLRYAPKTKWQLQGNLVSPVAIPLKTKLQLKGQFEDLMHGKISFLIDKGNYTEPDGKQYFFQGGQGEILRKSAALQLRGEMEVDKDNKLRVVFEMPNINKADKAWTAKGQIIREKNPLDFEAKGVFFPEIAAEMHLHALNLPLFDTSEYQVEVSPDLWLEWKKKELALRGKIVIPKASLNPQSFNHTAQLSKDAAFIDAPEKKAPLAIKMGVELEMGDAVSLSVLGLKGLLEGSLFLKQEPMKALTATGELRIVDGKYTAYGQDLALTQGSLLFTGGPIESPQLALRASKSFDKKTASNTELTGSSNFVSHLTVGVDVSGALHAPKVALFSSPSLPQAEILSYLLLGKPVSQANKAGGQLILAALSSMQLGSESGGKALFEKVKKTIDMDISFENATKYNRSTKKSTDSNSIVVGKSLSKKFYLSYNMGLSEADANVITLKYLISKFFSLQVNASKNASGIDLLYTKE